MWRDNINSKIYLAIQLLHPPGFSLCHHTWYSLLLPRLCSCSFLPPFAPLPPWRAPQTSYCQLQHTFPDFSDTHWSPSAELQHICPPHFNTLLFPTQCTVSPVHFKDQRCFQRLYSLAAPIRHDWQRDAMGLPELLSKVNQTSTTHTHTALQQLN